MPSKKEPKNTTVEAGTPASKPKAAKAPKAKKTATAPAPLEAEAPKTPEVKPAPKAAKKTKKSELPSAAHSPEVLPAIHVSHENIQLRAYFIGENRRIFGQHGDSQRDWLEAEAQLLSEARSIEEALRRTLN
ncbi:MAG: DUF2934 domain-containing protein [Verrucomicrobia bacterium]|nr:DUF2934 domain-containing protein [Verrucomicrobiota bacterium]